MKEIGLGNGKHGTCKQMKQQEGMTLGATLKVKFFDELTTRELYEILWARTEVFLMEQGIVCQDMDGVDYDSLHCFLEKDGKVLAYLRAYYAEDGSVKIGRVLSVTHGEGLGARLMREAIPEIKQRMRCRSIALHAQVQAQGFYEKLGFTVTSSVFLEENIPHVAMMLDNI